ncbi:hypothetical protein [Paenibacillus sp. BC26]|uniref:hypothetical protein n=1 Tax=Paenibacillus sp. BC26 TaxID=1881032 RepID=UPI0008E5CCF0|nr:hypothetical protein [Paenibacillus sp. BC26]SFS59642.1 hypothetical protein SAMN05428962_1260 [Paenibacillus sp. BC26]
MNRGNPKSIASSFVIAAVILIAAAGCTDKSEQLEQQLISQQKQLTDLQAASDKLAARLMESEGKVAALTAEKEQLTKESEQAALIDKEIPGDVIAFFFNYLHTVQSKPEASAPIWDDYFADNEQMKWFIDTILSQPELSYAKLTYQGETTYKKPGISNQIMRVFAYKADDQVHAYALSNVNHTGWKIVDVD